MPEAPVASTPTATEAIANVEIPPARDDVRIAAESAALSGLMQQRFREAMAKSNATASPPEKPATSSATTQPPITSSPAQPAPAAPVVPAESDPEETVPEHDRAPARMSKEGKDDWKRFRAMKDALIASERKDKEAALKKVAALEEASKTNGTSAELEAFKKEKADLEAKLERYDLENSPRFKNHYDNEIAKQFELIKEVGGEHAEEIIKLVKAPRSTERTARLREIKDELGLEGDIITSAAAKVVQLSLERTKQLDNHQENLKLLRATEAREEQERLHRESSQRTALAESIVAKAKELPEFKATPTDSKHTEFAAGALEFIRSANLGKLAREDAALLPVAAMKGQYLEQIKVPKLEAEVAKLTTRIEELTGATPKLSGQVADVGTSEPPAKTPDEMLARMMKRWNESKP